MISPGVMTRTPAPPHTTSAGGGRTSVAQRVTAHSATQPIRRAMAAIQARQVTVLAVLRLLTPAGLLAAVIGLVTAVPAWAGENAEAGPGEDRTDSSGVPLSHYQMDLDDGGWMQRGNPGLQLTLWVVESSWNIHRFVVDIVLWLLNASHTVSWLKFIVGPVHEASLVLRRVFIEIGLPGIILAAAMLIGLISILRGRLVTALSEMIITCIAVALFLGVVTDPVRVFTGERGILTMAPKMGQVVSGEVVAMADGSWQDRDMPSLGNQRPTLPGPDAFQTLSGKTADAFIRKPYEILMFGKPVPEQCQGVLTKALKDGPYDARSGDIRKPVIECDSALEAATKDAQRAMVHGGPVYVSMFFLLVLACVFAITHVALMIFGLWEAGALTWRVLLAAFPGNRLKVMQSALALIGIVVAQILVSAGLTVLMIIIDRTLNTSNSNLFTRYIIIDVFIIAAIIVLLVYLASFRRRSRERAEQIDAKTLSPTKQQPGGDLQRLVQRTKHTKATVQNTVSSTRQGLSNTRRAIVNAPAAGIRTVNQAGTSLRRGAKRGWDMTLGLPVTAPRAAKTMRAAAKDKGMTAKEHFSRQKDLLNAYGKEYKHNLGAGGRAAHRSATKMRDAASGRTAAARAASKSSGGPRGGGGAGGVTNVTMTRRDHSPGGVGTATKAPPHRQRSKAPASRTGAPNGRAVSKKELRKRTAAARKKEQ